MSELRQSMEELKNRAVTLMDTIVTQALQRCIHEVETNACIRQVKDRAATAITVSLGLLAMIVVILVLSLRKLHILSLQMGQ